MNGLVLVTGGTVLAGYRRGGHPAADHAVGRGPFEEFLAERFGKA